MLIECVINISEGRDAEAVAAIAGAGRIEGAALLHVDRSPGVNRSVISLAGDFDPIQRAAFNIIRSAAERIDMRRHQGVHPCIGAADVCPFVPLWGATMSDCIACARAVGKRAATELGIPVYLYGAAAADPSRAALSAIRQGGCRGLQERLARGRFLPDFGGGTFNARAGGAAIGAREILIAYNINLAAPSLAIAQKIAARIRFSAGGECALCGCQAIGWFVEEYGLAQVSTNLTDYRRLPPHIVFEAVKGLARELGTAVSGSELIGLAPKGALLAAGRHYNTAQKAGMDASDDELLSAAVIGLGLDSRGPSHAQDRILEEALTRAGWALPR